MKIFSFRWRPLLIAAAFALFALAFFSGALDPWHGMAIVAGTAAAWFVLDVLRRPEPAQSPRLQSLKWTILAFAAYVIQVLRAAPNIGTGHRRYSTGSWRLRGAS